MKQRKEDFNSNTARNWRKENMDNIVFIGIAMFLIVGTSMLWYMVK